MQNQSIGAKFSILQIFFSDFIITQSLTAADIYAIYLSCLSVSCLVVYLLSHAHAAIAVDDIRRHNDARFWKNLNLVQK